MTTSPQLDHDTLKAIRVLAWVVEELRVPGVLEFRVLGGALAQALETGLERDLKEASRVFQSLDRDIRARIVIRATEEARARQGKPAPEAALAAPARPPARRKAAASGLLSALNGFRTA